MARMTSELIISLIDRVTAPSRAVNRAVASLTRASRANARAMAATRGQMMDSVAVGYALARSLSAPVDAASEFQSAMADVRKVTDFNVEGLRDYGMELRRLSTGEIPMAVNELAALSAGGAQGGVADADLLPFTEIAAKSAVAWDMAGEKAGLSLAHIKTALQLTVSELGLYSDAINHLSNNTASAASQLVDFTERVGAQGEVYGFAKEESLAFGAAMISTGAEANVAATSFRNMGRALTKGASATARQRGALRELGLDSVDVANRMQEDAVATTIDVMQRLRELPEAMQASMTSDIFGDEARALAPLLANLDELQRVLGLVGDQSDYAGSAQAEFEVRSQTFENTTQRLKNQMNDLAISIGNALLPSLTDTADTIGPIIMAVSEWAAAHPDLVRNIILATSALVGLRIAMIATRYAFLFMKGGVIDLALGMTRLVGALLLVLNPLNLVKAAMVALRFAVIGTGIGAILMAIAMAGVWIWKNWDGLTAFFQGFGEGVMTALEPLMPVIQPIVDAGKELLGWVSGLLGPIDASETEWRSWGETLGTNVGQSIQSAIDGIKGLINWVTSVPEQAGALAFDIMAGTIDPFMQWLWDVAVNGIQLAVDVGKAAGDAAGSIGQAVGDGWNNLFGGGKAGGGSVASGTPYLVGELGPELFIPNAAGEIMTASRTARMLSGLVPTGSGRFANDNAANNNAPGGGPTEVHNHFGDIIVQGGANASAEDLASAFGDEVADRISASFSDGGV